MRSSLWLAWCFVACPALAQTPPPPQMSPPPPAVQPPPPTSVKPLTVKPPTVKGTKAKSNNCRDATSGKFVTAGYAKKNPTTTVCETTK